MRAVEPLRALPLITRLTEEIPSSVRHLLFSFLLLLGLGAPAQAYQAAANLGFDPVRDDPTVVDREFPPRSVNMTFVNEAGERIYGLLYIAQGKGPHPTLILVPGFPGYETNLDFAQSLRRAGFNVVTFHYRGTWGSDGTLTLENAQADLDLVVRFLRKPENADASRVDPAHIGFIGHSLGGFLALQGAAADPFVDCVAALSPVNMGVMAKALAEDPHYRSRVAAETGDYGPVKGVTGDDLIAEIEDHPEYELATLGSKLSPRPVLIIGASNDTILPTAQFHAPLAVAYQSLEWPDLEVLLMDGDHAFSWSRQAVAHKLTDWATRNCVAPGD